MRQIKFRAWHKEKKRMSESFGLDEINNNITGSYLNTSDGYFDLDDAVALQFTGLKDKNGKEIYEGDILRATQTCQGVKKIISECVWDKCGFFIKVITTHGNNMVPRALEIESGELFDMRMVDKNASVEVIGNVYENPELLRSNQ